ncbi:hypothetical protein ABK040_002291 [Willaertia magna]
MTDNKLRIKTENNQLTFYNPNDEENDFLIITFHRTLRIPDDDKIYPLPPSLGNFPIKRVDDYLDKVPDHWKNHGGVFIPLFQREALWLEFLNLSEQHPHALKIAVGKVNALSGETWDESLKEREVQDYCVTPLQPWLDGINAGDGFIKQFVAMPLGSGYSVEKQVTGEEKVGGVQLVCYKANEEQRKEKFKPVERKTLFKSKPYAKKAMAYCKYDEDDEDECEEQNFALCESLEEQCDSFSFEPSFDECLKISSSTLSSSTSHHHSIQKREVVEAPKAKELSLAAGGKMKQQIIQDPYGVSFWDETSKARVFVHIVNSEMYRQITGENPPETPISAQTYTSYGYPWFDTYNENVKSVGKSSILGNVKSVKEIDQEKHLLPQQDDSTVNISNVQVIKNKNDIRDGDW